ncbi:DUF4249 domain-containing protein [Spirosoma sp. KCTC 42546]|uniref:DUF4249 domain-containing protein n=1 Tax=Spirosoma sp. KCTC 42546 TaxID=2520506 RepID=UPI00115C419E|nr:DUF4249 domain-containing protein [Spirosoma sp. KCTC 42546]QDK83330.1 DUF4249 domain-containing protein [Spirosoma sp. KCTC 42546]
MQRYYIFLALLIGVLGLNGCTTVIDAKLDTGPIRLSVEGILTDQPGSQTITLTTTAPYFDNSTAPAATSATVTVADDAGKTYQFVDPTNTGKYVWQPAGKDTLGHIGRSYQLTITYQGETYKASSKMNPVPPIDSIIFVKRKLNPLSKTEGYRAEFYATDFPNRVDYYRIRFFQNGELQNKPRNIITSQDGVFGSNSSVADGLAFIVPIRRSVNPDSLYALNDVVKVEVHSLTQDAFTFWQQLRTQITNGGLFATPPANVPTNIINTNVTGRTATGFFMTSAVRSRTASVVQANIRVRED